MPKTLKVPHTLVLLLGMMFVAYLATWIVPQGFFDTIKTENGRLAVVPGTYQVAAESHYLTPWDFLTAIPRAFAAAQDVIFFVLIVGGVLAIARATGTVDALIGRLLEKHGDKPQKLIFAVVFFFAMASSAIGTAGEYIPFVLILVALCKAMRLDAMTAVGMIVAGYGIGYGVSAFNPFTVLIAQQIAEVPVYSGLWLRLAIFVPFVLIGFHHVWTYTKQVQADPSRSLMAGIPCPLEGKEQHDYPKLNGRHQLVLISFLITLVIAVWGIATKGWYLYELGGLFVAWGLVISVIGKLDANTAANKFIEGTSDLVTTAILIGVARGIALILDDGKILHSLVYGMSLPLSYVSAEISAVGMLVIQTLLNTFIPSGSGQAMVTMPILIPVADLVGMSRQLMISAFQIGDGLTNLIVPTSGGTLAMIALGRVSYEQWLNAIMPFMLLVYVLSWIALFIGQLIGY